MNNQQVRASGHDGEGPTATPPLDRPSLSVPVIDLNCDAGESFGPWPMGNDEALIPLMTSVNIACGAHAGDPVVMRRTVELAARHGVAIGAHPGYPDLQGFGRRALTLSPGEVEVWVQAQVGALSGIARAAGVVLQHVKPHGALYNTAADDPAVAEAIARAVHTLDPQLMLIVRAGSIQAAISREMGLTVAEEAFVDRGYNSAGHLIPRNQTNALIASPATAAERALLLLQQGGLHAEDGTWVAIRAHTLCIHGDTPHAAEFAQTLRHLLLQQGVAVQPLREILAG
jgi:UPF0271 protein